MDYNDKKSLIIGVGSLVLGLCIKEGLRGTWRMVRDEEPPDQPYQSDFSGAEVLAWTVATAAVTGLVKGLYTRYMQKNDFIESHFGDAEVIPEK